MQTGEIAEVFSTLKKNKGLSMETIEKLGSQPSIAAQNKGIKECAELVLSMMKGVGLSAKVMPIKGGSPVVYGEYKSGAKDTRTLLFYNHYDVQPPEPLDEWDSDPFKPEVRGGRLYGRGVSDNKANVASRIVALRSVLDTLGDIPINVKWMVEGEEEIGSPHLHPFLAANKSLLKADGCLWEGGLKDVKGRPQVYLGVKGMLYVEFRCRMAGSDQHSMWAPLVPNAAWQLIWALESMKESDGRIQIEGFYDDARAPDREDRHLLQRMPFDEDEYRHLFGISRFVGLSQKKHVLKRNMIFGSSFNVAGFNSGYTGEGSKTVLPAYAYAKADFRLVPDQQPDDIFKKLKRQLKKNGFPDVEVVKLGAIQPARVPSSSAIAKANIDTAPLAYGMEPVVMPMIPGSGPMADFSKTLKTHVVSGECTHGYDSKMHAPNENIRIADYLEATKHVAAMMIAFGEK